MTNAAYRSTETVQGLFRLSNVQIAIFRHLLSHLKIRFVRALGHVFIDKDKLHNCGTST